MVDEGKMSQSMSVTTTKAIQKQDEVVNPFISLTEEELAERNKIMMPLQDQLIQSAREETEATVAMVKATKTKPEKSAEEKVYLVLLVFWDNEDQSRWWTKVTGRTAAYNTIKENIDGCDIYESMVMVEGSLLEEAATVYDFMKYVQDKGYIEDTTFDIEDYNVGYEEADPSTENTPIVNQVTDTSNDIIKVSPFTHLDAISEEDV